MKQKILFIFFCVLSIPCFSQIIGQQKTLGGFDYEQLGAAWPTADGGVVLGGRSYSGISGEKTETNRGGDDYWVVKLSRNGDIEWQRTLGGNDIDEILDLQQTRDGGYILTGNSSSYPSSDKAENKGVFDFWVVKLNKFGSVDWQRALGGDGYEFCNSVRQTRDGGYLIGGSSNSYISGDKSENSRGGFDYWVVKLNGNGDKMWDKTIGGSGDEFLSQAIETADGGYFLGGISPSDISGDKSENSRGLNDFWAVKLDKNRNIQWQKTAGGSDNDYVNGLIQTPDGGFVLSGSSGSYISGEKTENPRGLFDFWLVKFSKTGKIQFDKTMGGMDYEWEATVDNTYDGGLIVAGNSASNASGEKTENSRGGYDYWVLKLNRNGTIAWNKTIGGSSDESVRTVKEIEKDKFIIGGSSSSGIGGDKTEDSRGGSDYWIVTLRCGGTFFPSGASPTHDHQMNMNKQNNLFRTYPNPTRNEINVYSSGKMVVSLINQGGDLISTSEFNGNGKIDVSKLPAGLYYLKNNNSGQTQKIVVIK